MTREPFSDPKSETVNTGVLTVYKRCPCCTYCDRFLPEIVTCGSCGQECSCQGCIADEDPTEMERLT